jgi:hypothetical protein
MLIVIDTNIFIDDYMMRSARFAILLDYARKTEAKIVFPKIVADELAANYERVVRKHLSSLQDSTRALEAFTFDVVSPKIDVDINDQVRRYLRFVKMRLGVQDKDVVGYREGYLEEVLDRAIKRRKPCTDRGEEIRDAILWLTILDMAESAGDKVVFISRNTKQFAASNSTLDDELLQECKARLVTVDYLPSLDEFAKQHASRIDFITGKWLEASLPLDEIVDQCAKTIERLAERRLERRCDWWDERYTGYYSYGGGSLEVDEFFVYEMEDGSYRVETILVGLADVEYEVECSNENYDDEGRSWPYYSHKIKTMEIELVVTVEATIEGKRLTKWSVVEAGER